MSNFRGWKTVFSFNYKQNSSSKSYMAVTMIGVVLIMAVSIVLSVLAAKPEEETGELKAQDGSIVMIGGILSGITRKITKTNTTMAFLTLEDLFGTVEVVVFPRDYEKYRTLITEDAKLFIKGRVSAEEEKAAKLICMEIVAMDDLPRELWVRFENKSEFFSKEQQLYHLLKQSVGKQEVVIYLNQERAIKRLEKNYSVNISGNLLTSLRTTFGESQIKVVDKKR